MNLYLYDPSPVGNEYATFFFKAMRAYGSANGMAIRDLTNLDEAKNCTVIVLTDHLSEARITNLKNNGSRIIGFNVTDSSYISGAIRYAPSLALVDVIFMLSGIQKENSAKETTVDSDFNVTLVDRQFLEPEAWSVFDYLRRSGRLQSLPYVPWTRIPDVPREPFHRRSQKVIMRGGGHALRFILALCLLRVDKLDPNSGFILHPYFADDMNPQFRYCSQCRSDYKTLHKAIPISGPPKTCTSPAYNGEFWSFSNLGHWNNRCPRSFFWMAEQFSKRYGAVDMAIVEKILNARWLHPAEYMKMLARITFTADLKWTHSIYAPQRFWEAAACGCINVMPNRALTQEYFPQMKAGQHYMLFDEHLTNAQFFFSVHEDTHRDITDAARQLYDQWIAPTAFAINSNLLAFIFERIRGNS